MLFVISASDVLLLFVKGCKIVYKTATTTLYQGQPRWTSTRTVRNINPVYHPRCPQILVTTPNLFSPALSIYLLCYGMQNFIKHACHCLYRKFWEVVFDSEPTDGWGRLARSVAARETFTAQCSTHLSSGRLRADCLWFSGESFLLRFSPWCVAPFVFSCSYFSQQSRFVFLFSCCRRWMRNVIFVQDSI